ncbi:hypothetical protein BH10PSE7_BH10PSE7_02880 [soil metagenome]
MTFLRTIGLGAALLIAGTASAGAVGLCDCCAQSPPQSCAALCSPAANQPAQCHVAVDYDGPGGTVKGVNPLTGLSLQNLSLGEPSAGQLERFRKFLEKNRRRAVRSHRGDLRLAHWRMLDDAALAERTARYRQALVNYYHGIRAYLVRVGAKPD